MRIILAYHVPVIEDLRELFEDAGLVAPPVPDALEPRLRQQADWVYATREIDAMAMYMLRHYLLEAVAEPVEDYVAISHAGHGANSYGLNYQLVYGPVAIFAQTGWGGVYTDPEQSAASVTRQLEGCAELIGAVEAAADRLPDPPMRLIVAESDFAQIGICEWLDAPLGDEASAAEWLRQAEENRRPDEPLPAVATAIETVRAAT